MNPGQKSQSFLRQLYEILKTKFPTFRQVWSTQKNEANEIVFPREVKKKYVKSR